MTITSPADGSTFASGETITFTGSANDNEDGNLTAKLAWTSSIGGDIGTGGSFSKNLSEGTHTITAAVTDLGGKTGSDSIVITVSSTSSTYKMKVESINLKFNINTAGPNRFYTTIATIKVVDSNGNPLGGVSVSGSWSGATTDTDSGTTDNNGQVIFQSDRVKNPASGTTFTIKIDSVSKIGWEYDSSSSEKSDSISV